MMDNPPLDESPRDDLDEEEDDEEELFYYTEVLHGHVRKAQIGDEFEGKLVPSGMFVAETTGPLTAQYDIIAVCESRVEAALNILVAPINPALKSHFLAPIDCLVNLYWRGDVSKRELAFIRRRFNRTLARIPYEWELRVQHVEDISADIVMHLWEKVIDTETEEEYLDRWAERYRNQ